MEDASISWAEWLLRKGRGKEATDIIQRARAEAGRGREAIDNRWRAILDSIRAKDAEEATQKGYPDSDEEMGDDS